MYLSKSRGKKSALGVPEVKMTLVGRYCNNNNNRMKESRQPRVVLPRELNIMCTL